MHGIATTGPLTWFSVLDDLRQRYRVVTFDQRWHGRGIRSEEFTLDDCADDAVAVLDALGIERAIVVGYSMGGAERAGAVAPASRAGRRPGAVLDLGPVAGPPGRAGLLPDAAGGQLRAALGRGRQGAAHADAVAAARRRRRRGRAPRVVHVRAAGDQPVVAAGGHGRAREVRRDELDRRRRRTDGRSWSRPATTRSRPSGSGSWPVGSRARSRGWRRAGTRPWCSTSAHWKPVFLELVDAVMERASETAVSR